MLVIKSAMLQVYDVNMKQSYWRTQHFRLVFIILTGVWLSTEVWLLATQPLSAPLIISIFLGVVFTALACWLHYSTLPIQIGEKITQLADTIETVSLHQPSLISTKNQPPALRRVIEAFNRFTKLEEGRLKHEHAFSAEASHQLRTPLAGIRLQAQIAQRVDDPEKRTKALNNIITAIDKNTHLVEQLLAYSRLTSFRHAETLQPISITADVESLLSEYADKAKLHHIILIYEVAPNLPQIPCNPQHITLLLKNLLDNAIYHTPHFGKISVKIHHVENAVHMSINDSGPGISPDEYAIVQSPFQTSMSSEQIGNKKGGTGLGLAIVKRIADIYNTSLDLNHSPLGGLAALVVFQGI